MSARKMPPLCKGRCRTNVRRRDCKKVNCLRRPYSFCASKKNMERKTGQRGARKAPLWKLPKCRNRKHIVPQNESLNLRVLASFSARDAAASCRLFGATGLIPRYVSWRAFKASLAKGGAPKGRRDWIFNPPVCCADRPLCKGAFKHLIRFSRKKGAAKTQRPFVSRETYLRFYLHT